MNKLTRTINRRIARETRDTQEVFQGVYGQPRGLRRGIVTLGRCQQAVLAARISDHDKDETVMVVKAGNAHAILSAPPSKAGKGPTSSSTFALFGAFLIRQEPEIMEMGVTTPVTYFGHGLNATLTLEYQLPRLYWVDPAIPEAHPDVSIANLVVVDSKTATADVTVAADAQWQNDPLTGESLIIGPIDFTLTF